jgi:hypothetical protein
MPKWLQARTIRRPTKDKASLDVIEEKRAVFYKQTAEFKSVSDYARPNAWEQLCEECDPSDLTVASTFWKLSQQLKSKAACETEGPQQITDINREPLRMDAEKGEAFKARFISQMQANPEQIAEEARREVETRIHGKDENTPEPPVDVTDLDGILSKIRKDSSPYIRSEYAGY